jgi:hypothetical protein
MPPSPSCWQEEAWLPGCCGCSPSSPTCTCSRGLVMPAGCRVLLSSSWARSPSSAPIGCRRAGGVCGGSRPVRRQRRRGLTKHRERERGCVWVWGCGDVLVAGPEDGPPYSSHNDACDSYTQHNTQPCNPPHNPCNPPHKHGALPKTRQERANRPPDTACTPVTILQKKKPFKPGATFPLVDSLHAVPPAPSSAL